MKKVFAIAITVMMLLTMAVVMPVSATTVAEEVNLVKNGSFELDTTTAASPALPAENVRDYDLDCWTQVSETAKVFAWATPKSEYGFNPPTEGNNVCYVNAAGAGIRQIITLEDSADYYTNQSSYSFELSYSTYNYGGRPLPVTNVTIADASGNTASNSYTHELVNQVGTGISTYMNYVVLDELFEQLSAPVKAITLEFVSNQELSLDYIKLVPVYQTVNLIENGSFEDDVDPNPGQAAPPSGATADYDLAPWTQLSETTKMVAWATAFISQYNPPIDGVNVAYVTGTGAKGLSQTITMADDSEYYVNQSNYEFILSFDTYAGGTCARYSMVTLTTADGATISHRFDHVFQTADIVRARMYHNSFNITELFKNLALPAKTITVTMETDGELCIDNIKLSPYPADEVADANMLTNGSFETVTEGNPDGWRVLEYDNDLYSLYTTTDGLVPEGINAVKLTNIQGIMVEDGETKDYGGTLTQNVTLEKGSDYVLEYKYKAPLANAALLTISNISNEDKIVEKAIPATSSWAIYKQIIRADKDMTAEIALGCHPSTAGAEVYYDDIKVTKVTSVDSENLLFNGGFEMDSIDTEQMLGWDVTDGNSTISSIVAASTASAQGSKVLSHSWDTVAQTVKIVDEDMAFTQNCKYTLDFEYASPIGGRVVVVLKYAYEDNTQDTTVTYTGARINADGTWNESNEDWADIGPMVEAGTIFKYSLGSDYDVISIDLNQHMPETTSPLKSITVQINPAGTVCNLDNFVLRCDKSTVEIVDANGAAIADITTNAAAAYTAKATYYGADEGAMAYIAVYTKDANGNLRLTSVANAAVAGDGVANTSAALAGINATAGTTVVKAFILGTNIEPIASATID